MGRRIGWQGPNELNYIKITQIGYITEDYLKQIEKSDDKIIIDNPPGKSVKLL